MRISTSQIYDAGTLGIQRNQSDLFKLQNQLSTGRRVLTPEDDPVAAAQALVVTQSREVAAQHAENQGNAKSQLGLLEGSLSGLSDLLQNVRERVVQAGNTTLTNADRSYVAKELQGRFEEMLGIANATDGSGQFLFSGYRGATRPFAIDPAVAPVPPATVAAVKYSGDDGLRLLQVAPSRQLAGNVAGSEVFMNVRSGNGTFVAAVGGKSTNGVPDVPAAINSGAATIDAGSVLDTQKWQTAVNAYPAGGFRIEFAVAAGTTTYQIYDGANNALLATPAAYTPGQAIRLQQTQTSPPLATAPADFGAEVVVQGLPANGDSFTVGPSTNQSLFTTLQNLVGLLNARVGDASLSATEFSVRLSAELSNLDRGLDNVSRVRADVGSRLKELDALSSQVEDLGLQYATTLSDLQDLDYAAAISDYTKKQLQLEAAQKSFAQISGLSLFSIL